MIDTKEIEQQIKLEVSKKINDELSKLDISDSIADVIVQVANDKIDNTVTQLLNKMIKEGALQKIIESKLLVGIQDRLEREVKARAASLVSNTDLGTLLSDKISMFIEDKMTSASLPDRLIPLRSLDLTGLMISADNISKGVYKNLRSNGIQDIATDIEMTVMDKAVVIENGLISKSLSIQEDAELKGNVNVMGDLRLEGDLIMLNPNFNKQIQSMVSDAISADKANNKMDIGGDALYANGKQIVSENALGSSIALSNLRKVGNLQDLNVIGELNAAGSLTARDNRVGINTDDPAGALTIWDEDAEVTFRKYKNKTMFIGSTRDCDIVLGNKDRVTLSLRQDGTVAMNKLELASMKIYLSETIPEHEGSLGELVIMSRPSEGQPWAYQCLGGKRWSALKR